MSDNLFNAKKLTKELQNAEIPVESVSSDGSVIFQRDLTKTESSTAQSIIDAHDPGQKDHEIKREAIANAGVSPADMLHALWKKVMNDDPTSADDLKTIIDEVLSTINS